MNDLEQQVKDKLQKICVCKAISKHSIKESIRGGACTLEQVIEKTGATKGACKGHRCMEKIQELITEYENQEWQ